MRAGLRPGARRGQESQRIGHLWRLGAQHGLEGVGREAGLLAFLELFVGKGRVVVTNQRGVQRVIGKLRSGSALRPAARRARRARRPASTGRTAVRARASRRRTARRRHRARRPASASGSRGPWPASACRPGCRPRRRECVRASPPTACGFSPNRGQRAGCAPAGNAPASTSSRRWVPRPKGWMS